MQDVRFALRMIVREPGFTVIAVLTLALGISAVTLIFSVVNSVLLAPLPYDTPDELVALWTRNDATGQDRYFVSPQEYQDWRDQNTAFAETAAFWRTQVTLKEDNGDPVRLRNALSTPSLFSVLRTRPLHGRVLLPDDRISGAPQVAVLEHGLWQRRFGGDTSVIGTTIDVDDAPVEIVGVLAPGTGYPEDTEIWTNFNFPFSIQSRAARWLSAVGRVSPGVTLEAAQADMNGLARRLESEYPNFNEGWTIGMGRLHDLLVGDLRTALFVLMAATGLILVIACANVANLLMSKSEPRAREIAVRAALGASRWRLARQLLTESLVLASLGALVAALLTFFGLRAMQLLVPSNLPRMDEVGVDTTVMGVALATTLATGVLFGLAPVLRIWRTDLAGYLKDGAKGSKGKEAHRIQAAFVIAQLAMALVLLVGASLLARSFLNLRTIDPGFRTTGLLTFETNVPNSSYQGDGDVAAFYTVSLEALSGLPGVTGVTAGSSLPLRESPDYNQQFTVVDRPPAEDVEYRAYYRQVDYRYFDTMGVPLLAGRGFESGDVGDSRAVAVVNRSFARTYFGNESPVNEQLAGTGMRFGPLGVMYNNQVEIVGVVEDIRYAGLAIEAEPSIYFPLQQAPFRRMVVALRTDGDPTALVGGVRTAMRSIDPGLPVGEVAAIESVVSDSLARERFSTMLLSLFGVVALLLSTVGIYGVLSFSVEQRLRELGIRMALGAGRQEILRLVLRGGAVLVVIGLIIGSVGAFAFARALRSQLFGIGIADPLAFLGAAGFLFLVALLACYIPALRATRADPLDALRAE
jgi:putative ABC transport system permease protein